MIYIHGGKCYEPRRGAFERNQGPHLVSHVFLGRQRSLNVGSSVFEVLEQLKTRLLGRRFGFDIFTLL
jgi:hypothetical protein